jgi:hypothetical protein
MVGAIARAAYSMPAIIEPEAFAALLKENEKSVFRR